MSVIRSASIGPTGSCVSLGPRSSPRSLKSRCWLPMMANCCDGPAALTASKSVLAASQNPSGRRRPDDPGARFDTVSPSVADVGPQGSLQITPAAQRASCRQASNAAAPPIEWPRYATWSKSSARSGRRAGSQRLDDEGGIGRPHVRDLRSRGVPTGNVAQERWIDATEGGRGHHVAVRELDEGGAGGVDADDRVAVAGQVLGQRRVRRDGLTEARRQHDDRRVTIQRRAGRWRACRPRSGPGTRSPRRWRGPPRSAAGMARPCRTIPGTAGYQIHTASSGTAIGGEWVGPSCIVECELDPPDRGRAGDGGKRESLGHRDGAGGGDADDRRDKADDDAVGECADSIRPETGPPRAPGGRCCRKFSAA